MSLKKIILLTGAVGFLSLPGMAKERKQPNVLLITADDMSWDSLGCTGNSMKGISPNLDKLAGEGMLFENCFITTPICGPSRNTLYTGQHPQRKGYMGHGVQPPTWWKNEQRDLSKKSITSELHKKGYLTGIVGKHGTSWCKFDAMHCSNAQTGLGRDPAKYYAFVRDFFQRAKKEGKPFYLAANTHDPHKYWARDKAESKKWFDGAIGSTDWKAYENGKPYPDPKTHYKAEDVAMPAPYPNDINFKKALAPYFDSVNRMDEVVGEVLRALEESGMAENTIVMFLSDHGLPWELSKWSLYPSGTKTPLIVRWPGKVRAGQVDNESVISVVDIVPTLAAICGLPSMEKIDGKSFQCLMVGERTKWKRRAAFSCFNYMNNEKKDDNAIKDYTTDLYKKVEQYRPSRALNTRNYSYVWNGWADGETTLPRTMGGGLFGLLQKHAENPQDKTYPYYKERAHFLKHRAPEELYDIRKDPGCFNNLVKNPKYKKVIKAFRKRMTYILKTTGDHELKNYTMLTHLAGK